MHIGILQTGHAAEPIREAEGDYDAMFARLLAGRGLSFTTWNVVDGAFPDGPEAAEGWLITGSRHGAYDDLPWIAPLERLIRDIQAAGVPMVGICFGHQIVAQALGGRVEKFAGGWAVGRRDYRWGDETLSLNAWHQDQVVAPPAGARVVACNEFCENAALVYGDRILTVQPHPEFSDDVVRGLIEHRGGAVPQALLDAARARLGARDDAPRLAERIAAFLKAGAKAAA